MKARINFEKVMSQARQLRTYIQELNVQINNLTQLQQDLHSTWKGEASSTFSKKVNDLVYNMQQTKNEMEQLVQRIERVAQRINDEDTKNAERASQLHTL